MKYELKRFFSFFILVFAVASSSFLASATPQNAPFDSVYAPFDSVHAPFDSVHAPFDSVHAPFDSVHAPFDPSRPSMSGIIVNISAKDLKSGLFSAVGTIGNFLNIELVASEKLQGYLYYDWSNSGINNVKYPIEKPIFVKGVYIKPDDDISSVLNKINLKFNLNDSSYQKGGAVRQFSLYKLDTLTKTFNVIPSILDSISGKELTATVNSKGTYAIFTNNTVAVEKKATLTNSLTIQNRPNPFYSTTSINFNLTDKSTVDLSVFDINGRFIKRLVNGNMDKGSHSVSWRASENKNLPGGTYIYRLKFGNKSLVGRMVKVR